VSHRHRSQPMPPWRRRSRPRPRIAGVTLLELMVAVAIVGILAVIALPSYESYRLRTARAIGKDCLIEAQRRFENYFAQRGRYPDRELNPLGDIGYAGAPPICDQDGLYALTIEIEQTYARYTLIATARGRQARDGALVLRVTPGLANPNDRMEQLHTPPSGGVAIAGWNFPPGQ